MCASTQNEPHRKKSACYRNDGGGNTRAQQNHALSWLTGATTWRVAKNPEGGSVSGSTILKELWTYSRTYNLGFRV